MKKIFIASLAIASFGSFAFGLSAPSTDTKMSKGNANMENIASALKAIHDGGLKCDKITDFKPSIDMKSFDVQCDEKANYTVVKTDDNGMVLETK